MEAFEVLFFFRIFRIFSIDEHTTMSTLIFTSVLCASTSKVELWRKAAAEGESWWDEKSSMINRFQLPCNRCCKTRQFHSSQANRPASTANFNLIECLAKFSVIQSLSRLAGATRDPSRLRSMRVLHDFPSMASPVHDVNLVDSKRREKWYMYTGTGSNSFMAKRDSVSSD